MDKEIYLKAISDAALNSGGSGGELIFFTNGMIIVALLLIILWCRIRYHRRMSNLRFPEFCDDCFFLFNDKIGFCTKECKHHPVYGASASISYHQVKG
ncbi:MAG: hypothetical protein OEY01_00750 [Desulfobulbaceae bacterium]|nr:hypothetical protein [Desulfobulbaceae bacterium]HIJ77821.1 hypothetical protein [Deltaproteobacteria bacterium]